MGPQKGQQSISSFFTSTPAAVAKHPKATTSATQSLFVDDEEPPRSGARKVSSKRIVDNTENDDLDDSHAAKRLRLSDDEEDQFEDKRPSLASVSGNAPRSGSGAKSTGRTSKYLFPESSGNAASTEQSEPDTEDTRQIKQRLHEKFVKKLGRPDSMASRRNRHVLMDQSEDVEGNENGDDGGDEEEAELEPEPPTKGRGRKSTAPKRSKDTLTPLERQVIDIKRKHADTVLVVEVGYKFRFFGEDARVAAKELSIVCIPGKYRFDEHPSEAHLDRFASASIPVHRLHVHVKRLVSAGHKVGIVRQLETAALKKAGENRNSAFQRGLTNLYTKGTYIDDQEALDGPAPAPDGATPSTGHILCLTETDYKGWGSDEKVQIGFVAVQPATGDIIYDDFEDGWMRSELETRLLHIAPCEFVIVGDVSKETDKLIQHLSGNKTNVFGDKARVERVDKPKNMAAQAYSHITRFYADKMRPQDDVQSSQGGFTILDKIHKLSENATVCLSAMITHFTDYGLQHVFDLTKYFQSFSARSHMLINGNTLTSLEIYRNLTDYTERGSLFWSLDHTHTRFGQRLLRKWLGRPLLDRERLNERVGAVEELHDNGKALLVDRMKSLLRNIRGDLERSLIRIYYKRCTRLELLNVLQSLQMISQEYAHVTTPTEAGFQSSLINEAVASLPKISDDVVQYLDRINAKAAKSDDKYGFFQEEHESESITDHKMSIVAIEHDLEEYKKEAAQKIKKPRLEYVTVAGIDYLIEVDNTQLKNVPASWAKISGTKKVSRYHTPEVVKFIRERDQHKEGLANACDVAFAELLTEIGSKYQIFRDCVQSLALLDCLLSLAEVAAQPGYCKPEFTDDIGIDIEAGRHPMVEQLLLDTFVPNDIHLSSQNRALLITGPNMGGKSSYVRSVALISILAQIGSYVPATSARIGLLDAVFTRMGAFDNMMKGESTFMVELSETSDIIKQASPRSLVILDELGRGTSTHDGVAIAQAVLDHAVRDLQSMTLFITHHQTLARMAEQFPDGELKNAHMRFSEREDESGEKDVTFLYEVGEGVAHRSYGLNVAKLAGLPKSVLDEALRRSAQMESEERRRRVMYLSKATRAVMADGNEEDLERLVKAIELM